MPRSQLSPHSETSAAPVSPETEPVLRVIIEKTPGERILYFLWQIIKIIAVFIVLSSLMNGAAELSGSQARLQKNYYDGYFSSTEKDPQAAEVAVILLSGEITEATSGSALSSLNGVAADDIIFLLHTAASDPDVKAILLQIDSPGGTVLAAEKISTMIREVRQEKPVFALLEGSATSGAYYIAAATQQIFTYESSLTGNIGVVVFLPEIKTLLEKLGIEMRTIASGSFKDMGSMFREMRPEERALFSELIDESYERFISAVAKNRGLPLEKVRSLADGRVYSGKQAIANGLADTAVKSFAETLENIRKELQAVSVQAVSFAIPLSPWEEFLFNIQGKFSGFFPQAEYIGSKLEQGTRLEAR